MHCPNGPAKKNCAVTRSKGCNHIIEVVYTSRRGELPLAYADQILARCLDPSGMLRTRSIPALSRFPIEPALFYAACLP